MTALMEAAGGSSVSRRRPLTEASHESAAELAATVAERVETVASAAELAATVAERVETVSVRLASKSVCDATVGLRDARSVQDGNCAAHGQADASENILNGVDARQQKGELIS